MAVINTSGVVRKAFKIFEISESGAIKTLFHGVNRSRTLEPGRWYSAEVKLVSDGPGGQEYFSGFHVFLDEEEAKNYLPRFTANRRVEIKKVLVAEKLTKKPTNGNVHLATHMKIIS